MTIDQKKIEENFKEELFELTGTKEFNKFFNNKFAFPNLHLGEVGFLFGEEGIGKSYLILQAALYLATKENEKPLVFSNDRVWLNPRLKLDNVVFISLDDEKYAIESHIISICDYLYKETKLITDESIKDSENLKNLKNLDKIKNLGDLITILHKFVPEFIRVFVGDKFTLLSQSEKIGELFEFSDYSPKNGLKISKYFKQIIKDLNNNNKIKNSLIIIDGLEIKQDDVDKNNSMINEMMILSKVICSYFNCSILFVSNYQENEIDEDDEVCSIIKEHSGLVMSLTDEDEFHDKYSEIVEDMEDDEDTDEDTEVDEEDSSRVVLHTIKSKQGTPLEEVFIKNDKYKGLLVSESLMIIKK